MDCSLDECISKKYKKGTQTLTQNAPCMSIPLNPVVSQESAQQIKQ